MDYKIMTREDLTTSMEMFKVSLVRYSLVQTESFEEAMMVILGAQLAKAVRVTDRDD